MGHAINVTSCPATSSITTCDGSFLPQPRASRVDAGIPIATTTTINTRITGIRAEGESCQASSHQSSPVASAPQVPGPGRSRPAPKNVATSVAHRGAEERGAAGSVWLLAMPFRIAEIVGLRVVQWRRNHIGSAGPFAQIDYTTAVAAERKLGIGLQHDLPASRTTKAEDSFLHFKQLSVASCQWPVWEVIRLRVPHPTRPLLAKGWELLHQDVTIGSNRDITNQ